MDVLEFIEIARCIGTDPMKLFERVMRYELPSRSDARSLED